MPTIFTTASRAIAAASIAATLASPSANAQAQPQTQAPNQLQARTDSGTRAPGSSAEMSAAEELANLQAQIPILEARARIAKLKAEIDNGGNAPSALPSAAAATMPPWGASPAQAASGAAAAQGAGSGHAGMQAVSISGFDGRYRALLTIEGRSVSVRPGDMLDGGWKVESISESSVTLARGKQLVVLRV